jgi:MFS family permease
MFNNISAFIKNKEALSIGFLFSISSLLFGTWVAAIPGIKYRLGFSDGSLGLSLLLSPLGAICGMLLSTRIFSKIPVGKWMLAGYSAICIIMVLQVNAFNRPILWTCLFLYGLVGFLNGVSANTTVNMLEKKYKTLLMSTCHGMYSLGGAISAAIAAGMFALRLTSAVQIVVIAALILIVLQLNKKNLLDKKDIIHSRSGIKLPNLTILGISFICMVTFMAEGCVADWSAIYLKETLHSRKELISLGYVGFSIAMTIGRLNGDPFIKKIGRKRIVIAGSLLAAVGFALVSFIPQIFVVIIGYTIVGLGCSCIVPVLFSTSANIPGVSIVEGFAMITTGGLIGFLSGPSMIGFISEHYNLSTGFSLLILLAVLAGIMAWKNKYIGISN